MRIYFSNISRPKIVAKKLKASLEFLGVVLRLADSQRLTAQLYGYRDWHELNLAIGTLPHSPDDEDISASQVAARREYQALRLVGAGIPKNKALYALLMICPTARSQTAFYDFEPAYALFKELSRLIGATGFRFYTREEATGMLSFRVGGNWIEDPIRRMENALQLNQMQPRCGGISTVWPCDEEC